MNIHSLRLTDCPEKYFNKLIGNREIEDSLERLDKLTQEEARMAYAEQLRMTHSISGKVTGVEGQVEGVRGDVQDVRGDVRDVGYKSIIGCKMLATRFEMSTAGCKMPATRFKMSTPECKASIAMSGASMTN